MHTSCKRITRNTIFCFVVGAVIYESYLGEHHIHIPEQHFSTALANSTSTVVSSGSVTTSTTTTL